MAGGDSGAAARDGPPILVVEDNEANEMLALRQLQLLGYPARVVRNGREAVEAVGESRFALILMDLQMPEMDGFEATRLIREREGPAGSRIPIIAMTANATGHDREACLAAGMDDYISKPVLLEALGSVLARWAPGPAVSRPASPDRSPPAGASDPSSAVDAGVLRRLRGELGEDAFIRFVRIFLSELPRRERAIREALEEGAADPLRLAAHTLKSTSAALGATHLAAICGELEGLGRADSTAGAGGKMASLGEECDRLREFLERELRPEA